MPYNGQEQVHMGNRQGVPINSFGYAKFIAPHNNHITLTLNNLLHVPHITKNLVSVSQFAKDNHVFFEFHSNACFVKSQVSKQVILQGSLGSDGLYSFKDVQLVKPSGSFLSHKNVSGLVSVSDNKPDSYSLWHSRLGHAHSTAVKSVLDMCRIAYQNKVCWIFVMRVAWVNLIGCMLLFLHMCIKNILN